MSRTSVPGCLRFYADCQTAAGASIAYEIHGSVGDPLLLISGTGHDRFLRVAGATRSR